MITVPSLLTIDVGNTAVSCGLFPMGTKISFDKPQQSWIFSTGDIKPNRYKNFLHREMKKGRIPLETVHDILISSVVPRVDRSLCKDLKALFSLTPRFVSASSPSKIKIHYKSPSEVGADRLVNARAAWALHKGPSIVIDFGTATTFDCISGKGEYLGGVIAPGPVISAEALYQKTAKLPFVLLEKPVQILGRNTLESIQAGLYYGYRGLVQEITLQLKRQLGGNPKVFATGGQAHWILKGVKIVDAFVPHLTHLGIFFYWQDGQKEI